MSSTIHSAPKPPKREKRPKKYIRPMAPKRSRRGLIHEIDALVSHIVRKRHPYCVTCNVRTDLTCSHFFRRGAHSVRFDLINCSTQCRHCNSIHNDNTEPYRRWFIQTYGEVALAALADRQAHTRPWKMPELIDIRGQYEAILTKLNSGVKMAVRGH